MISYRNANIDDIDILTQMRVSMLCDGTDYADEFKEKLQNNTKQYMINGFRDKNFFAWVADLNGEIIAMSGLTLYVLPPNDWCPSGKSAYIGNMYTLPDFRGQGIGSKLLILAMEAAKEMGSERILLNATDMGRPIYEKYGFENSTTAMAHYPFGICNIMHIDSSVIWKK
jgi:GNAT superfamily N-acetyltransferase